MKKAKKIILTGVFLWSVEIHSTALIIQEDFSTLNELGYTGKGVIVGVMDRFLIRENQECHGNEVVKFIRAVAPDVVIKTESVLDDEGETQCLNRPSCLYDLVKKDLSKFTLRAFAPCCAVVFKAAPIAGKRDAKKSRVSPTLERYCASPESYPEYELCHFSNGDTISFRRNRRGDLFSFEKDAKSYCVRIDDLKESGHFFWQFSGQELRSILKSVCLRLPLFEDAVKRLLKTGARMINASFTIPFGLEEKVRLFEQSESLLIKSAGNIPLSLGVEEINFSKIFDQNQYVIDKTAEALEWCEVFSQEAVKHCIIVGQLDHKRHRCRESTMAGGTKSRYASVVLDKRNLLSGTSFAAPQVTGLLALLKEAYPSVSPTNLAEALLKTSIPLKGDERGVEGGKGCINPLAAFREVYESYGVLPQGIKGQTALLPEGFEVEMYLALNVDIKAQTAPLSDQERVAFATGHYLSQGKKEKRPYGVDNISKDFNVNVYLYQYDDLISHTNGMSWQEARTFATWHYVSRANVEKRTYKPLRLFQLFNPDLYLYQHSDVGACVREMSLQDARSFAYWHYSHYGHKEKRTLCPQGLDHRFVPVNYLTLNPDVARCTKEMTAVDSVFFSIWHYLKHGKIEARKYG